MTNIIAQLGDFTLKIIDKAGYAGVFVLSVLENVGLPIPSEIVVPFSGFLVSIGKFNFWFVIIASTVGNLIGSVVLYFIGRSGGRWILEKYGKYLLIHSHEIKKGDAWFRRYGGKTVFWGRLVPVIRSLISLPAGVYKMSFGKFCGLTLFGSLIWNLTLAYIGVKTGENWSLLHNYFRKLDLVTVLLIVVLVIWYLLKHKRKHV